jgi:cell division septal protein FtsQ
MEVISTGMTSIAMLIAKFIASVSLIITVFLLGVIVILALLIGVDCLFQYLARENFIVTGNKKTTTKKRQRLNENK